MTAQAKKRVPPRLWARSDFTKAWVPSPHFVVKDVAGLTFRLAAEVRACRVFAGFPVAGCMLVLITCYGRSLQEEVDVASRLEQSCYEPWCSVNVLCLVRSSRAYAAMSDERDEAEAGQLELG